MEQWRQEVFERLFPGEPYDAQVARERLSKTEGVWYNSTREYSALFEKNFDLPRQRRMFVEKEVAGKSPNLGYAYLIRLVDTGFINTMFTTNFDDLLTESFFQFSQSRPMMCAHDSAISSVSVTSARPKIIKLHGDYLFDDIKSTVRETESLEENTRKKFVEFGRNFGLVVVGYSGCDRSIMDVLQYLLRSEDHFKHGIYWCIRKGETPSDELIKLLWRDRVYFVEIDGFDELMGQLHNDLIGSNLPIDTGIVNDKPRTIIKGFCENTYLRSSTSEVIKRDLEILERQNSREELFSTFRDYKRFPQESDDDELSDRETVAMLEIRRLIDSNSLIEARERIKAELEKQPGNRARDRFYDLLVRTEELAGDIRAAIRVLDDLISLDPLDPDNYIRKSHLLLDHKERMDVINSCLEFAPHKFKVHNAALSAMLDARGAVLGFDSTELNARIDYHFQQSVRCNPGLTNWAWSLLSKHLFQEAIPKDEYKRRIEDIITKCSAMDPTSLTAFRARVNRLARYKEDRTSADASALLSEISHASKSKPQYLRADYIWLEMDAMSSLERHSELSKKVSEVNLDADLSNSREFLVRKAKHLMEASGDLDGAIASMKSAIKSEKTSEDILTLARYLSYKQDSHAIATLTEEHGKSLYPIQRHLLSRLEFISKGNIEGALAQLRAMNSLRMTGVNEKNDEIHDLIILKKYREAEDIAKAALDQIGWSINHPALIVNYELARARQGESPKKSRLLDVIEKSGSEAASACAHIMVGTADKCREILKSEIRRNRENFYLFSSWAIFADEKNRKTLDAAINQAS
ncbi:MULTISPECIES: SIR2 family protein [Stenotrophomonas]|uniref:SIR2 family protein n=1 Tax=Stenotrophomonas TaxID=40323 RepID=UPI002899C6D3|nr:SIR2 family protein [Stenotrophomonas sp.]